MKRHELQFLNFFTSLLDQGYDVDDILILCHTLHFEKESDFIKKGLSEGNDLGECFLKYPFSSTFTEYFSFFKNTFSMSESIKKTLVICLKKDDIKKKLIKKLFYPFCLLCFLFIFSLFIIFYLLPQVENLFIDFEIEKSLLITILFGFFKFIPVFIFLLFFISVFLTVYVIYHVKKIHYHIIDLLISKTHMISALLKKYYSLKFAIYYEELLHNHYDATTIIEILYNQINDSDIKMIIYELYRKMINGSSLYDAIDHFPYFEEDFKVFYYMMEQNHENKSLSQYIDIIFLQLDSYIDRFIQISVPLIYGFVAGFVILVYISIIIPMMNVVTNL